MSALGGIILLVSVVGFLGTCGTSSCLTTMVCKCIADDGPLVFLALNSHHRDAIQFRSVYPDRGQLCFFFRFNQPSGISTLHIRGKNSH
jgi:hypothetical protein